VRGHAARAAAFVADEERTAWHDRSLWFVRERRDAASREVPEWETLRNAAARIKRHTLANLADHLEAFEANARALGASVHWARNAEDHNEIVLGILERHGVRRAVKSKSMLTEECGLNPFLEARGIDIVDTDLGERIVQLRREPPSHIVMPAIHLRKEEVGLLFHRELGSEAGLSDPTRLTGVARAHLRKAFLAAEAGLTGVNFGVAETGGLVVCTNEGNADLGTALPPLHIASMGIEKLVPRAEDLAVMLRLLARSATGQAITAYTSHFHGPRPGGELHIVLVDNGRSALLARDELADALSCIRCGACMNTCPVFRRSGGHSYAATIPGPIGSVLEPARDANAHASLPLACSLCGSCKDICPVRIDLPEQIRFLRADLLRHPTAPRSRRLGLAISARVLERPRLAALLGALARCLAPLLPRRALGAWSRGRELPPLPRHSFRSLYRRGKRSPIDEAPRSTIR
jgi:L-lactate dehydrogenase complex protein LldF